MRRAGIGYDVVILLDWEQRIRVKVDRDRVMVAGYTWFHTRIKGLTSLVGLPKIGKPLISKS